MYQMLGWCGKMKVVHKTNTTWIVEVNDAQVIVLSDMDKPMFRANLFNLKSVKDTAKRQEKKKYWDVFTPELVGEGSMHTMFRYPLMLDLHHIICSTK